MNIHGINPAAAPNPIEPVGATNPAAPATGPMNVNDVVEISTASQLISKVHGLPDVRAELVAQVRGEIEAGTYETPQRIEEAVRKLMDDLFLGQ